MPLVLEISRKVSFSQIKYNTSKMIVYINFGNLAYINEIPVSE